jgi:diguanylate cyclase (GGDEF)-like protein
MRYFQSPICISIIVGEFYHAIVSKNPLCILMMDIDEFKAVNDCYGHIAGDKVLAHVAGLIQNELRQDEYFVDMAAMNS